MRRTTAASAPSASSPSASMTTRLPLPAASIMTPMMLFAFTRRPLRDSHTSAAKPPATRVSFAAARACSPSLLTIPASACGIAGVRIQVDHAVPSAAHRLVDHGGERFIAVGERTDQHGETCPRQAFDFAGLEQARGDVRRRRAQNVGEHEHPVAAVELARELLGLRQDRVGIVVDRDAQLLYLQRPLAEHGARAVAVLLGASHVRNNEYPDHGPILLLYGDFQGVEKHPGDVEAGLLSDLLKASRAGDIDLGEPVPDHVQPHEEQPLARDLSSERIRDFLVSPREQLRDAVSAARGAAARLYRIED